MATFAERFTQLRKENGMTQEEVAKRLNLSKGTIGNYEAGTRTPKTFELLEEIADFFNCNIDYLLGRTAERPDHTLEEEWLIQCYRNADKDTQTAIKTLLRKFDARDTSSLAG